VGQRAKPQAPVKEPAAQSKGLDYCTQLVERQAVRRPGVTHRAAGTRTHPGAAGRDHCEADWGEDAEVQIADEAGSSLPLEIVNKGRFDKSEPTIHKGEDLDVPTYIRRGLR